MTEGRERDVAAAAEAALPPATGVWLFLFALALRLPLLPHHRLAEGDGVIYVTLARAFLAGDVSALANPYWSNLWPGAIALVAWLTHLDVVTAGRVASLLAGCGLAPATASLASRTLGRPTGIVAGVLVASHPWLIHFSTLLFTESFFAFLLVMLLRSEARDGGDKGAAASGAWAGLAVVTRPEAWAPIAAVPVCLLHRGGSKAELVRRASLFLVVVLPFLLARGLLVHRYHGIWDFGGTKATANLFVGLAGSEAERERVIGEITDDGENALDREASDVSPLAFALTHPRLIVRHAGANSADLLASALRVFPFVPLVGGRPRLWEGGWPPLLSLWAVSLSVVAAGGLAASLLEARPAWLVPLTGLLYATGLSPLTVHDRLVVPLVPLFLVFLAHGLARAARLLLPGRATRQRGLIVGAAILGGFSLSSLIRAPALDYATDPVVQRETGEWLAARYPQDTAFVTAAAGVDFYFHDGRHYGLEVSLPWADYPRVIEFARRRKARVLAVPVWYLKAVEHPAAAALLHPEACVRDLRLVAALGSGDERMLIYELRTRPPPP